MIIVFKMASYDLGLVKTNIEFKFYVFGHILQERKYMKLYKYEFILRK